MTRNERRAACRTVERAHGQADAAVRAALSLPVYQDKVACTRCKSPACCSHVVPVSRLEADGIFEAIRRMPGLRARLESRPGALPGEPRPCPFLDDGRCSIYEHRPFVCRAYVAMGDPNDCEVALWDTTGTAGVAVLPALTVWLAAEHQSAFELRNLTGTDRAGFFAQAMLERLNAAEHMDASKHTGG